MNDGQKKALDELHNFGEKYEKFKKEYEAENDKWWDSLSYEDRCRAFYAITRRIYHGDIAARGSYRYVLYNVFDFEPDMYGSAMDSGYMDIHNCLYDGGELAKMKNVTRFEVIDDTGRAYVKYLKDDEGIKYSLQDDDKTLKVFIDGRMWKDDL